MTRHVEYRSEHQAVQGLEEGKVDDFYQKIFELEVELPIYDDEARCGMCYDAETYYITKISKDAFASGNSLLHQMPF